jgi:hypothetical protein
MVLAEKQGMLGKGMGWETPARVINSLINGPGFYVGGLIRVPISYHYGWLNYDGDRIVGIVLFWFLIGLSIDRRTKKQTLDQRHPIRAGVLFAFAALVCGFFGTGFGVVAFRDPTFWHLLAKYPLQTPNTMLLGLVVWLLVFCLYFAKRAIIAARRSIAIAS